MGVVLAVTRVALFVWVVHQRSHHIYTETNIFILEWLYAEVFVSLVLEKSRGRSRDNLGVVFAFCCREFRDGDADTARGLAEAQTHDVMTDAI